MDTDTQQQSAKPISDDQELAKVLAGVSQDVDNLSYEETPPTVPDTKPIMGPAPITNSADQTPQVPVLSKVTNDLDSIKMDALTELRPLVDKLELEPEEKFDIYLLLLRSTDDKTLIAQAHEAAKSIADEAKRAQALLDIVKEIDYFSAAQQTA